MLGLELVVVLCATVLVCQVAGDRLRIAPPVLLLAAGALLGFVPALREVHLPPEAMLLLFLPALLYWESLTTSLRGIRQDLRGIMLMSTALVILTAWAVAAVAHALGLPWGPAWVLGAAVAPTDATTVGVLARILPRRSITLLRAESLINDGTALVVYGLAVGITVGEEHFSVPHVGWLFLLAYVGGAAAGAVTAWLGIQLRRRLDDPLLGNVVSIGTPFTAFLLAEEIEASGVLAVVVAGLIMSQVGPRLIGAATRRQGQAFWSLSTFLLNASLFVLVGLEAQSAVRELTSDDLTHALITVGVVSVVLVAVRFTFQFAAVYLIRLLDRRPQQRLRRMSHRARVVGGVTGFRGAVSLAVALSVPETLDSGAPFPDRDVIVFVTSGVIMLTLVVQGLLLPRVVRWARLPRDTSAEEERSLAETTAAEEALKALPEVAAGLGTAPEVADWTRHEYETHLRVVRADDDAEDAVVLRHKEDYTALSLALLDRKRATVVRLRDENHIDDTVLRQVQAYLDIEEVRLSGAELSD
ncbi:Na+/H+ antiporter [Streptomyces sp. NBC_01352]|uniref:Na+/H+ antiporter n=1 Tax=Streptomyces sp. NBC_01352 TaxID=2903834 RepID=UPI002E339A8F|nr:Na+/H+ antiporter [Streptomyces sp. NBC_01352]